MSELPWRYLRLDFFHPALKNPPRGLQKEKKRMNMAAFLEYKSVSLVPVSTRI